MDDDAPDDAAAARISPVPREARPFQGQRAGLVTRLIAAVLDAFVVGAVLLGGYLGLVGLLFLLNPRSFTFPELGLVFSLAASFAVAVVYLTVFWTLSGRPYGFFGAAVRAVFVVAVPIGILWVPLSRNNKSLQDLALGTRVVYDWQ